MLIEQLGMEGYDFNPRPHMGSDRMTYRFSEVIFYFNPRPHMGSDRKASGRKCVPNYFNPRPHMGSDNQRRWEDVPEKISIHAPTWGATAKIDKAEQIE